MDSNHHPYPGIAEDKWKYYILTEEPRTLAFLWIEAYAKSLVPEGATNDWDDPHEPVTTDELIDAALETINDGWEFIVRGGLLEGRSPDPLFWEKLAILKEMEIPHSKRNSFFSCSC